MPRPLNSRGSPNLDNHLHRSATSDSARDNVGPLDIQFLDLETKFQSLLKKTRDWAALDTPSKKSDIFASLQTALVDLRVWAYDLSEDTDSIFECLRNLSSGTYASLQQTLGKIEGLLTSIEGEADNHEEVWPRFVTILTWYESCVHQSTESRSLNSYWINARGYAIMSKG